MSTSRDIKLKRDGEGIKLPSLNIRTFQSDKDVFIVIREEDGSFHAFVEVDAKAAALRCGSQLDPSAITQDHWRKLWDA